MLKVRRKETGQIIDFQTNVGVFKYSFLLAPQTDNFGNTRYKTNFYTEDVATIKALEEAIVEVATAKWGDKVNLETLKRPYEIITDENNKLKGIEITAKNKDQPLLFVIDTDSGEPIEVDENNYDEFYSGMEGEIIVGLYPYSTGTKGVSLFLNGVCKTGQGTPYNDGTYSNKETYRNMFRRDGATSSKSAFDFTQPTKAKQTITNVGTQKAVPNTQAKQETKQVAKKEEETPKTISSYLDSLF